MKTLKEIKIKNKRVLVRCDFNVPLSETSQVVDDFRIKKSVPTIKYLLNKRAKIILISHLGKPKGQIVEALRLTSVKTNLEQHLGLSLIKADDCLDSKLERYTLDEMKPGQILILENLRFYKGEEDNKADFARKISKLGDFYVNDAFAASHRAHASIVLLPKYLPSCAGLLLAKEVKILSKVIENPWRPLVIIIGGVKIDTKIGIISNFLNKADQVLLAGQIANTILQAKGIIIGKRLINKEILRKISKINLTYPKLHLPLDGAIALENRQEQYSKVGGVGSVKKDEDVFDIGPETIKVFSEIVKQAKMILWSGPLGMFEDKRFENGTRKIAEVIARNHSAFKIAGGGDTIAAINKFSLIEKFDHVSTGGGAMLEFISGKKLPGLAALK